MNHTDSTPSPLPRNLPILLLNFIMSYGLNTCSEIFYPVFMLLVWAIKIMYDQSTIVIESSISAKAS